jgi:hypothetical protein
MELNSNTRTRFSAVPGTKVRLGPDGIHLYGRGSGANLLIGEIVPPRSMWAAAPRQVSIALTNSCDLACSYCFAPKTHASLAFDRIVSWLKELDANGTIGVGFGGGEPKRPGMEKAFEKVRHLLEKIPGHPELIEENGLEAFGDLVATEIEGHSTSSN